MRPRLFTIANVPAGKLSIMARPRGGEWLADEITCLKKDGVDTLLSLLEDAEIDDCGLFDEKRLAGEAGIVFRRYPITDRHVPSDRAQTRAIVASLAEELRAGRHVVIHCRAGIGRSALMAACVLIDLGMATDNAWDMISKSRGVAVPDTEAQRRWVLAI